MVILYRSAMTKGQLSRHYTIENYLYHCALYAGYNINVEVTHNDQGTRLCERCGNRHRIYKDCECI